MEWITNTHQYPKHLMEKYTAICAFNSYKKEFIETISQDDRFDEEHERKEYLVNDYPAFILELTEPFSDGDGLMKELPDWVVEQITEAIGSINLRPSPLTMKDAGDNYVLSVTYNDGNDDDRTKIILEYTFNKKVHDFEGYFAKSIENEHWLPDYEVKRRSTYHVRDNDRYETSILVKYRNNSSLKVNMESIRSYTLSPLSFPDKLQNCLTNRSLKEAVLRRIFPTKAHYFKHVISKLIVKGESDFRDDMSLTPLNWVKLSMGDTDYNLYAKYMLTCYHTNESQPIVDDQLSDEDKIEAMKILIEKYPFFTIDDDQSETDIGVLDLWTKYFKKELTSDGDDQMEFDFEVSKKLIAYYSSDPEKCSKILERFPKILDFCMLTDFPDRFQLLFSKYYEDDANGAAFNLEHVLYFNKLESTLPARWRYYLLEGGKFGEPACESGLSIIAKMEHDYRLTNVIEKVNYLHVKNEKNPLSEFQMRTIIDLFDNQLEILYPKHLEKKFQSYSFSADYKTSPTEMDSLAVRFANVYKDTDYDVPEIPDDFYDRLRNLEKSEEKKDGIQSNCVICEERTKSHIFPTCKHVCVCELCSYSLLECPICHEEGNPQRVSL